MDSTQIINQLLTGASLCSAAKAEENVPARPGYYAIFIDDAGILPSPFSDLMRRRESRPIYVGMASSSLRTRLVGQDLRNKDHSTFFRSIGAVLGFRPLPGSLAGKKNRQNYKFSPQDAAEIIRWMNDHLSIRWVEVSAATTDREADVIRQLRPLLNQTHNPEPVLALVTLREDCKRIARTKVPVSGHGEI